MAGAVKLGLDDNNYGLTNVAAGTQIQQVSKDNQPIDLSDEKSIEAFINGMYAWRQGLAKDKELNDYGAVELTSSSTPSV